MDSLTFPEWFGFALLCLWIVGMTNAFNLINEFDGLASGIALLGLLAVSVVGYIAEISSVTWMSTLLIGCLLGFLVYNSRPASIFLVAVEVLPWILGWMLNLTGKFSGG